MIAKLRRSDLRAAFDRIYVLVYLRIKLRKRTEAIVRVYQRPRQICICDFCSIIGNDAKPCGNVVQGRGTQVLK